MKATDLIKERLGQKILLLTHHNADPDSICAAILLQKGLKKLGAESRIGVVESISRLSKKIVEHTKCKVEADPSADVDFIILLDASSPGQLSDYAKTFEASKAFKLVIDHHTGQEEKVSADFLYVDADSTSTIGIVYSVLEELGVEIDKDMVFIALFGMVAETAHLRYASPADFNLIGQLLKEYKIDYTEILDLLSTPLHVSERIARLNALGRARYSRFRDYLVATSYVGSFEASAARALIRVGADLAVVTSTKKKEIRASIRAQPAFCKEIGIDVSKDLIPGIAKIIDGTGGGHPTVGGANGKNVKAQKELFKFVLDEIKKRAEAGKNG